MAWGHPETWIWIHPVRDSIGRHVRNRRYGLLNYLQKHTACLLDAFQCCCCGSGMARTRGQRRLPIAPLRWINSSRIPFGGPFLKDAKGARDRSSCHNQLASIAHEDAKQMFSCEADLTIHLLLKNNSSGTPTRWMDSPGSISAESQNPAHKKSNGGLHLLTWHHWKPFNLT